MPAVMWLLLPLAGVWVGYVAGALVNPTVAPVEEDWADEPPVEQHWLIEWYPAIMTGVMVLFGVVIETTATLVAEAVRVLRLPSSKLKDVNP